jgi:hypothetical protein
MLLRTIIERTPVIPRALCGQMQDVLMLKVLVDGTDSNNCAVEDRECDWQTRI